MRILITAFFFGAVFGTVSGASGAVSGAVSGADSGFEAALEALQEPAWPESVVPGFDSIVRDPAAFRQVLDKFSAAQVRASLTDCVIAYYGFALQPELVTDAPAVETNIYQPSAFANSQPDRSNSGSAEGGSAAVPANIEENMQRALMADDYQTAYALGQEILKYRPVDLTTLYWTLFAATQTNQSWETRNSLRGRYNSISHVISLSGNGLESETAFRVINRSDMYTFTMLELGLEIGEGFLWDNRWTEFRVTPSPTGGDARSGVGSGERFRGSSIFFELFPGVR